MTVRYLRGFTLIEMLVVLAIAGLMLAVMPAALDRVMAASQYRSTLRAIVSDMREARNQALSQGHEVRFVVDMNNKRFGLGDRLNQEVPSSLVVRAIVADVELSADQVASIRFLPTGGATGGTIEVVRESGAGTRLVVDWLSGRVFQEPLEP